QTSAIDHPYKEKHTGFNNYQPRWDNAESFVQDIWPHARRAADQLGVSPDVLVAQSALETGWGKHVRYFSNGDNSFNLFGIKADKRWQGESISFNTLEFNDGAMQKQQARFRAYGSLAEAFNDYVDFIQTNPRYQPALEKAYNPAAFTQELQRAGYATDPDYAEKINRVRSSELIQSQVAKLKNSQQQSIL
ncbi:MAG: glucosaminidase domain-containing protein, partial [Gammaproteobacteria bacterium]|nr:glucosaminidase domain-containing protein [Gammaproteobacteria bacterium]